MTAKIIPFPTAVERLAPEEREAIEQYLSELTHDAGQQVISDCAEAVWKADEAGKTMCISYTSFQITDPSGPGYADPSDKIKIMMKVEKALKEQDFKFEVGLSADKHMISYLVTIRW